MVCLFFPRSLFSQFSRGPLSLVRLKLALLTAVHFPFPHIFLWTSGRPNLPFSPPEFSPQPGPPARAQGLLVSEIFCSFHVEPFFRRLLAFSTRRGPPSPIALMPGRWLEHAEGFERGRREVVLFCARETPAGPSPVRFVRGTFFSLHPRAPPSCPSRSSPPSLHLGLTFQPISFSHQQAP